MNLTTFISEIGFQSACVIGLGWFLHNYLKADREERKQDKEADRAREDKLLEANTELLVTNRQLAEHVEVITKDIRTDINRTENKIDKILEKVGV